MPGWITRSENSQDGHRSPTTGNKIGRLEFDHRASEQGVEIDPSRLQYVVSFERAWTPPALR